MKQKGRGRGVNSGDPVVRAPRRQHMDSTNRMYEMPDERAWPARLPPIHDLWQMGKSMGKAA